ncbi:MAG: sugar transferase [Acidobacteriaceae bacterium]
MATPEPIMHPASHGWPPRPVSLPHAKQGGSFTEAALTSVLMMGTDLLSVLVALWLALSARFGLSSGKWPRSVHTLSPAYLLLFAVTLLIVNQQFGLYALRRSPKVLHEYRRTLEACLTTGLLLCGCMYVMRNTLASRAIVGCLIGFTTLLLFVSRSAWRYILCLKHERGTSIKNVIIVGATPLGNALRMQISQQRHLGRNFKGFIDTLKGTIEEQAAGFVIGDLEQWERIARRHFVDEIIIADHCKASVIAELVYTAGQLGVEVSAILGYHGEETTLEAPVDRVGHFPVVRLHRRKEKTLARFLKRVWDFTAAAVGLVMVSPAMIIIALVIKLDSPGPTLYISDRIGRKGRTFSCLKFRTMVVNADRLKNSLSARNERSGPLFKIRNDPRVTRVGRFLRKFSLDELPQLLNVICGDMSLVGPRPPIASEIKLYELQHFRRLEVLPGLTGLWQVRARQDPSFDRYVALDLNYVENWTFWLDLKILARTAQVVFRGTGS